MQASTLALSQLVQKPMSNEHKRLLFLVFSMLFLTASGAWAEADTNPNEETPHIQVDAFIVEGVGEHGPQGITPAHIAQLVEDERRQAGGIFTLDGLRDITRSITRRYRAAGFLLARAYVPEQTVDAHTVRIRVLEGRLQEVQPEGFTLYRKAQLQALFADLVDQPVQIDRIESRLLFLNDYPGFSGFSVFRPGETPGSAVLVLSPREERPMEISLTSDNYGSSFTGRYRALLDVALNNPLHAADRFEFTLLQSLAPLNSRYGAVQYQRPLGAPGQSLGLGYSKNSFQVGDYLAELEIAGDSYIGNIFFSKQWVRKRQNNLSTRLEFSRKSASNRQADDTFGQDELAVLSLTGQYSFTDTAYHGFNRIRLGLARGLAGVLGAMDKQGDGQSSRVGRNNQRAGGEFTKWTLQLLRQQPLDFYASLKNQSLSLRLRLQYSKDLLTSLEQMLLAGPHGVRAYPISQAQVDTGYIVSLEWQVHTADRVSSWLDALQLSSFLDYGQGWLNASLANETARTQLVGLGVGAAAFIRHALSAKLEMAIPLGGATPDGGDAFQMFFNLRYAF